jgi:hypothetical protein
MSLNSFVPATPKIHRGPSRGFNARAVQPLATIADGGKIMSLCCSSQGERPLQSSPLLILPKGHCLFAPTQQPCQQPDHAAIVTR